MEKLIYGNTTLESILETISNGTVGFEENEDYEDLVITNDNDNLFKGIVIKPITVDITKKVLSVIAQQQIKVDSLETELLEFVVFTATLEENEDGTNEHVLINQSLSEYIIMMRKSNIDVLQTTGWKLLIIK